MIAEDYVSFETAKLLKEKGFELPSLVAEEWVCSMYDEKGEVKWGRYSDNWYCRITLQMAMKWLREKHNRHVEVRITNHGMTIDIIKYYWVMTNTETGRWCDESTLYTAKAFDTPEEAEEDAIRHALEKLI